MPYLVLDPTNAETAPAVDIGAPKTSYGKTLQNMRDNLILRLKNRTDVLDPDILDYTMLDSFINDAYVDVATSTEFTEQEAALELTLVAGQPMYTLPDNIVVVYGVTVIDPDDTDYSYVVHPIHPETYRLAPVVDDDIPLKFFEYDGGGANILVLYPAPDKAYKLSVSCKIEPMPLAEETDSPYLDRQFHEAIELLARVKAHSALSEPADASLAYNDFLAFMSRRTSKREMRDEGRRPGSSVPRSRADLLRYLNVREENS